MNLLINEPPLQVLPSLAVKIGLNNSIVVQQVHYWLRISNNIQDGHKWVYKTIDEWLIEFPFWSKSTLERIISKLEEKEILIAGNYNKLKFDRTKWYRINYKELEELCNDAFPQNEGMETVNLKGSKTPNRGEETPQNEGKEPANLRVPITRDYKETTQEITTEKSRKRVYDESSVEFQLAKLLYEKILVDDPSFKQPNLQTWSDHIRLMMERDKRTEEQIRYLIEWSQSNSFWKSNILSTKKLREKATTLIRQIKAEKEKQSAPKYKNNRAEHVPEWFNKHKEIPKETPTAPVEQTNNAIDFEAERQKILAKLGDG